MNRRQTSNTMILLAAISLLGSIAYGAAPTLKSGDILVVDNLNGVILVNPDTGAQTVVSTGGYLNTITNSARGIAVEFDGHILVTDAAIALADGSIIGGVVRIDPATGAQTLLSRGGLLFQPLSVDVVADGAIVVTDRVGVVRIDPVTGAQNLISSGGNLTGPQGLTVVRPKLRRAGWFN
jgi:hypothetical protein